MVSMPENKWMLKGKISELRGKIADVLKTRESLLKMLNEIVRENPNGRKYFVSKAAYFYFAPPGSVSKDDIDEFAKNGGNLGVCNIRRGRNTIR